VLAIRRTAATITAVGRVAIAEAAVITSAANRHAS